MLRLFQAASLAAFILLCPLGAAAQDLPLNTFFGKYAGSGIAEDADSLYFGVTVRDLDVDIGPEGDGFYVEWTSVIRAGGDPSNPDVRRRTTRASFATSNRPGVYLAPASGSPIDGEPVNWAYISGNTLSVNVFVIREDGGYEVQSYDRTLTGGGMQLEFTRIRDGEAVRSVEGQLVKTAN